MVIAFFLFHFGQQLVGSVMKHFGFYPQVERQSNGKYECQMLFQNLLGSFDLQSFKMFIVR